ncbi:hypothetical protein WOLCODRAFT_153306 [Wolfiporia cocos MD-104 SS10]|uniref:Uncharacterized protein n=1 Tax=Wolfiporia cocos (strain MD-104) TaxID=742152 RepID=A0A2H3K2I0_WOLCO|nr:hypothetical protein WOLCODRAFT_153306 [Wolfiporia cocos MD-104 SS10]
MKDEASSGSAPDPSREQMDRSWGRIRNSSLNATATEAMLSFFQHVARCCAAEPSRDKGTMLACAPLGPLRLPPVLGLYHGISIIREQAHARISADRVGSYGLFKHNASLIASAQASNAFMHDAALASRAKKLNIELAGFSALLADASVSIGTSNDIKKLLGEARNLEALHLSRSGMCESELAFVLGYKRPADSQSAVPVQHSDVDQEVLPVVAPECSAQHAPPKDRSAGTVSTDDEDDVAERWPHITIRSSHSTHVKDPRLAPQAIGYPVSGWQRLSSIDLGSSFLDLSWDSFDDDSVLLTPSTSLLAMSPADSHDDEWYTAADGLAISSDNGLAPLPVRFSNSPSLLNGMSSPDVLLCDLNDAASLPSSPELRPVPPLVDTPVSPLLLSELPLVNLSYTARVPPIPNLIPLSSVGPISPFCLPGVVLPDHMSIDSNGEESMQLSLLMASTGTLATGANLLQVDGLPTTSAPASPMLSPFETDESMSPLVISAPLLLDALPDESMNIEGTMSSPAVVSAEPAPPALLFMPTPQPLAGSLLSLMLPSALSVDDFDLAASASTSDHVPVTPVLAPIPLPDTLEGVDLEEQLPAYSEMAEIVAVVDSSEPPTYSETMNVLEIVAIADVRPTPVLGTAELPVAGTYENLPMPAASPVWASYFTIQETYDMRLPLQSPRPTPRGSWTQDSDTILSLFGHLPTSEE